MVVPSTKGKHGAAGHVPLTARCGSRRHTLIKALAALACIACFLAVTETRAKWGAVSRANPQTGDAARRYSPRAQTAALREECARHRANDAAFAESAKVDARYPVRIPATRGEPGVWDHFDASLWKCEGGAEDYSGGGDPKFICGFRAVSSRPCVVYSFGSRGETSFERQILRYHPGCAVHIFDPTVSTLRMRGNVPSGAAFHKIGISNVDLAAGEAGSTGASDTVIRPVMRLGSIMASLGHGFVDVLKIDVEGAEWPVLEQLVGVLGGGGGGGSGSAAPASIGHILVEVHLKPSLARGRRPEDALRLHRAFLAAGYRLVAKHILASGHDVCCDLAELSYVHREWLATMGPGTASEVCPQGGAAAGETSSS